MIQILKYKFNGDDFDYEVNHKLPTNDEGDLNHYQIEELMRKHVDDAYAEFLDKKQFERDPNVYYGIKER